MPKVLESYIELRREEILQAAMRCFARRGFTNSTMQDISREAGVSAGAIYRYFPGKEDIVEACAEEQSRQKQISHETKLQSNNMAGVIDEMMLRILDLLSQPPNSANIPIWVRLFDEGLHNPHINKIVRKEWATIIQRVKGLVEEGQKRGQINPSLDPTAVARFLHGIFIGLHVQAALGEQVDVEKSVAVWQALFQGTFRRF